MRLLKKGSFFMSLLKHRLSGQYVPLSVIFTITNRCNSKCNYCYAEYYKRKEDNLSTQDILGVVNQLAEMGNKRISLSGGEPLIREDIGKIVEHIKRKKILCDINTNGYLVSKKVQELKGVDSLCVSLDGDEKSHDMNREPGSFRKAMNAIECALSNKLSVRTNTVLTKNNLNSIDFIVETARKYNYLAIFNIVLGHFFKKEDSRNFTKADNAEFKDALKKIIFYKAKGYPILFSKKAYSYTLDWKDYSKESYMGESPKFRHARCWAGKYFCFIDTDGQVYPCSHMMGKIKSPNYLSDSFKKAFESISNHNCKACYMADHNEFNLFYNLDFEVILNHIRNQITYGIVR